ncbi:MAG: hypothetical protein ACRDTC_08870 [Pseudonocardiaceae bacterium]
MAEDAYQQEILGRYRAEISVGDSRVRGANLDMRGHGNRGLRARSAIIG